MTDNKIDKESFFDKFAIVGKMRSFMSTHSFPGANGKSLLDASKIIKEGFKNSFLGIRASALSFKFIMAAIPGLVILFIILPYFVPADTSKLMFSMLSEFLPAEIFDTISKPMQDASARAGSGILSIAAVISLYFAVNGMRASMQIFNKNFHIHENRSLLKQFSVASLMVFIMLILVGLGMAVFIFNESVVEWLNSKDILSSFFTGNIVQFVKWTIFFFFLLFFLSILYFLAPAQKVKFRVFSLGSVIATIVSFIAIKGFDFFINNFNRYNEIYGGLSALFILMLFVFILSNIFLIGFEINAAIFFGVREEGEELEKNR